MKDTLLIIFVKNIILGKVKTRLAKTIGTQGAFEVYKYIVELLEQETSKLECAKQIHFSDVIIDEKWPDEDKRVQSEGDIGERMKNAFQEAFQDGYQRVVLVGSDIPDLSKEIIEASFLKLNESEVVLGPSEDGGYYLIGLNKMNVSLFENVSWSTENVLNQTLDKIDDYTLITELNDIDTFEDLKKSSIYEFYKNFESV